MTPQELAAAGAALIRKNGWWDGTPRANPMDGSVCAWTALKSSFNVWASSDAGHWRDSARLVDRTEEFVAEQVGWEPNTFPGSAFDYLTSWNDDPARTEDEVLAALDAVAAS